MDNLTPITREEILMNDEPLTPITREEKILAGEDLTPVTRREYFLKKYRHAGGDVMVEGLEVTANGTYTAPEGKAYSPVEVAVPLPENAYLLKEANGSLVSFSDGADLPMPSFICNIDAVQDLHGYDAPWVGGAGKNKLPMTVDGIKALNTAGTWSGNAYTLNNITFTLQTNASGAVTGLNVNGTASANTTFWIKKNNTGALDFADGTSVILSGCPSGGSWDNTETYALRLVKNNYSVGFNDTGSGKTVTYNSTLTLVYIDIRSGVLLSNKMFYPMIRLATEKDPTFAPYSNICPISGHTGVNAVISPTTEASAGTTYSASWQTEAGEVYGGYVDLASGVLTATHKSQTGFTRGSQDSSNKLYNIGTISDIKAYTNASAISPYFVDSMFEKMGIQSARAAETPSIAHYNKALYIGGYIGKEAELDTLLETLQVKYELETPLTYQLTPTQIKSLLGNNNAWCSTGDVDIDYFAKEVTG